MSMPAVSIVMPVFQAATTLPDCLASIGAQTFSDFELLAIDDGSTDAGPDILQRAAAEDRRIRVIDRGRRGLVAALNTGLAEARADLVARMDADDMMYPERLARQWAFMQAQPWVTVLGTQVRGFPDACITEGFQRYLDWQNALLTPTEIANDIYTESPFAHPSVMFRRNAVIAAGGYRHGDFPEDYELWLRLHAAGHAMARLPAVLLDWRDDPRRTSRTDPRCAREAFDRLRASYLADDKRLHAGRPIVVWGAGRKTRKRVAWLQDRGVRVAAWIDIDARKIGQRIGDATVHAPDWLAGAASKPLVLVYVASHGAREEIEAFLRESGYGWGEDYLVVG